MFEKVPIEGSEDEEIPVESGAHERGGEVLIEKPSREMGPQNDAKRREERIRAGEIFIRETTMSVTRLREELGLPPLQEEPPSVRMRKEQIGELQPKERMLSEEKETQGHGAEKTKPTEGELPQQETSSEPEINKAASSQEAKKAEQKEGDVQKELMGDLGILFDMLPRDKELSKKEALAYIEQSPLSKVGSHSQIELAKEIKKEKLNLGEKLEFINRSLEVLRLWIISQEAFRKALETVAAERENRAAAPLSTEPRASEIPEGGREETEVGAEKQKEAA